MSPSSTACRKRRTCACVYEGGGWLRGGVTGETETGGGRWLQNSRNTSTHTPHPTSTPLASPPPQPPKHIVPAGLWPGLGWHSLSCSPRGQRTRSRCPALPAGQWTGRRCPRCLLGRRQPWLLAAVPSRRDHLAHLAPAAKETTEKAPHTSTFRTQRVQARDDCQGQGAWVWVGEEFGTDRGKAMGCECQVMARAGGAEGGGSTPAAPSNS
jgi:hypothetical protein